PAPDAEAMAHAQQHIDGLLKPPGSLGRLEALAVQLAGMPGLNANFEKPGFIVDGQQRTAALREADINSFMMPVSAFIANDAEE
ncbi:nicotinate-nucleotide--dimethylbenzimidazole phosphoribosyltransferase, partial [Salmonella enterica subsp. enterica serovar Montevideo]|nr:nicotinate-nucleotide--dimethylbenzimidazole phosphoribosyltransferase [Salmonella enterica subsp. enterica serovar Montevideo]